MESNKFKDQMYQFRNTDYQRAGREEQKNRITKNQRERQIMNQKRIIPRHEKLWVWVRSHKLMIEIFKICKRLPSNENYRLADQIQRSSKSVPDNIAEGCNSYYFNSKIKSYFDSRKEAGETQNHLREMENKLYINAQHAQTMIEEYEEIIRGINGLINKTCELRETYKTKGIKRL
jgi:four helix bundle protein